MVNIKAIISTPLSPDNYPLWSSQVMKLLKANGFKGYLTGSLPCPPQMFLHDDGSTTPNPLYHQWLLVDQNLSVALTATISPSILPYILYLESTTAIWDTLLKRLQATNRSRIIQLKNVLNHISLQNNTMTQYLSEVKSLVDQIATAGSQVDDEHIVLHILNGLPSSYQAFKIAIRTWAGALLLDDFYPLLISEEIKIANELAKDLHLTQMQQANFAYRGRGRNHYTCGRSRPSIPMSYAGRASPTTFNEPRHNNADQRSSQTIHPRSTICCQICHCHGHNAADCWYRTNLEVSPPSRSNSRALFATTVASSNDWILDSGATSNLNSGLHNLQISKPYHGTDSVSVGNGSVMPIANSEHGLLPTPHGNLQL